MDDRILDHDPVPVKLEELGLGAEGRALDLGAFPGAEGMDPFAEVSEEMAGVSESIRQLLGVDHPVLQTVGSYFFEQDGGKKFRPAMVVLMSRAAGGPGAGGATPFPSVGAGPGEGAAALPSYRLAGMQRGGGAEAVAASQLRLAEITEMIHTASLLHDDVIDEADTRRGSPSVNSVFGNKLSILAGDFLLARASICLARLRDVPVIECMSTIIEHLVKGEVLQMKALPLDDAAAADPHHLALQAYMTKNFFKTASLVANSCRSAAMLAGHSDAVVDAAYRYGKHTGLAFQVVDDVLDFTGSAESLGKPAMSDAANGIATAPVLFAAEAFPEAQALIDRKFRVPGDVETAAELVRESRGVEKAQAMAVAHAQMALDALSGLGDSRERTALAALVARVVDRSR